MIALAHLISLCSTSAPPVESCNPGNVCPVLFPRALMSFKGEQYSFAFKEKKTPLFVRNRDFITFDLKLSLLPPNILLIELRKSKKWFQVVIGDRLTKLTLLKVQSVAEWALVSRPFDSNTGVLGFAQQTSESTSPFRKSHRWPVYTSRI